MCGITGAFFFTEHSSTWATALSQSVAALVHRGPDDGGTWVHPNLLVGHRRLSIIDTSAAGHQPMVSPCARYVLAYNGEIYNYQNLRQELQQAGRPFATASDTEVLLQALIQWGTAALPRLQGFFAFAWYDRETNSLLLARDRMGIKPLFMARHDNGVAFASEVKALLAYPIDRQLDHTALWSYLQLNYSPGPSTLLHNVEQLPPGHFLLLRGRTMEQQAYYTLPVPTVGNTPIAYPTAQKELAALLERSVQERLVADVPLGAFLSGGIDSSVIVALASRHVPQLHTFSIGFKDNAFHDETAYAQLVARQYNTAHETFYLTADDLYESLQQLLAHGDHPFADSSAILVNALSKAVRPYVTVALSGDGADELFGGYHKYRGEWMARHGGVPAKAIAWGYPLWAILPKSRSGKWSNRFRQLHRFAAGAKLSAAERYWRWCGLVGEGTARQLLSAKAQAQIDEKLYAARKMYYTKHIDVSDLNSVLYTDTQLVLPHDMLTKVDRMSMLQHLEVRVPFLDHRIAEWAFTIPASYKVNRHQKKRVLRDTFRELLPPALYHRPKQGFEVPILQWMRGPLHQQLFADLLHPDYLVTQGLFNPQSIQALQQQLHSKNPGDAPARLYGLLQFQSWYKRVFG